MSKRPFSAISSAAALVPPTPVVVGSSVVRPARAPQELVRSTADCERSDDGWIIGECHVKRFTCREKQGSRYIESERRQILDSL
jgi:hypothetical protein